jgi:ankyrin repeat protein
MSVSDCVICSNPIISEEDKKVCGLPGQNRNAASGKPCTFHRSCFDGRVEQQKNSGHNPFCVACNNDLPLSRFVSAASRGDTNEVEVHLSVDVNISRSDLSLAISRAAINNHYETVLKILENTRRSNLSKRAKEIAVGKAAIRKNAINETKLKIIQFFENDPDLSQRHKKLIEKSISA